jgi:membrane-associated protein
MIHAFLEFLRTLTNPDKLLQLLHTVFTGWLGYALLFGIVFSETGLLVGFFLPGDSLMFTIGVVAGAGGLNIVAINIVLIAAALIGDSNGYMLGRRAGPRIFSRPNSRFFRQEHLQRTKAFYEKYGGKTIILAKFVPIVRTFAAFVSGVAQMPYGRFISYDVFGATAWVFCLTTLGYTLGSIPVVRRHFDKVILLIILVSVMPIVIELLKARGKKPETTPEQVAK